MALSGLLDGGAAQGDHVLAQAAHRGLRVQVRVVHQETLQAAARRPEVDFQIEADGDAPEHHLLDVEIVKAEIGLHRLLLLDSEHHLEQRIPAQAALRPQGLHQLLEGQVLVGVRAERLFLAAEQEVGEGIGALHRRAHHEGVDEEPDQRLRLGPIAVCDGRSDRDASLARVTMQQRGEEREHRHIGGGPVFDAERFELCVRLTRDEEVEPGAMEALDGGSRIVCRHARRRGVRQMVPPEGDQRFEMIAGERLALPGGEVGVFDFERRQFRLDAPVERVVALPEFPSEIHHRPAVGGDVMKAEHQDVVAFA